MFDFVSYGMLCDSLIANYDFGPSFFQGGRLTNGQGKAKERYYNMKYEKVMKGTKAMEKCGT